MNQIAIIGIGRWGKNLIREFSKISTVKFCLTTGNKENLKWLKKNYPDVIHTTKISDILNDSSIDAVIIATPIKTHYLLVKKILESQKHVFIEKPLAKKSSEINNLIKIAKKNKKTLFVGHVFLHNEIFKKLKLILKTESIKHAIFEWKKLGTFDEDIFENLLSHDLSLNLELFGIPKKVKLIRKRGLLTPIDDFTLELYFTKTQTSVITIDRTAHYKKKTIMIITKKNSYIWDDNELLKFNKETELYKTIFQTKNTPLYLECKEFVKQINAKHSSIDSAILASKISNIISKISK